MFLLALKVGVLASAGLLLSSFFTFSFFSSGLNCFASAKAAPMIDCDSLTSGSGFLIASVRLGLFSTCNMLVAFFFECSSNSKGVQSLMTESSADNMLNCLGLHKP